MTKCEIGWDNGKYLGENSVPLDFPAQTCWNFGILHLDKHPESNWGEIGDLLHQCIIIPSVDEVGLNSAFCRPSGAR